MIELPEAVVIAQQITETLCGKRIAHAVANASPHKFAWYTGDPATYDDRLAGKVIGAGAGVGGDIEFAAGDMVLSISAPIRYHVQGEKRPKKHQLLVEFEDGTAISSSAQMWGGFFCFPAGTKAGFSDADIARQRTSPLTPARSPASSCSRPSSPPPTPRSAPLRRPALGRGLPYSFAYMASTSEDKT